MSNILDFLIIINLIKGEFSFFIRSQCLNIATTFFHNKTLNSLNLPKAFKFSFNKYIQLFLTKSYVKVKMYLLQLREFYIIRVAYIFLCTKLKGCLSHMDFQLEKNPYFVSNLAPMVLTLLIHSAF